VNDRKINIAFKGVVRKISGGGGGGNEKSSNNSTIKPLPGGVGEGNGKKDENSTIKPLSTISAPCMKIQGGHAAMAPLLPMPMIAMHCTI